MGKNTLMTRYFIDTEFYENGRTVELISIGIVCEDGRELYLQSSQFSPLHVSLWVEEHVFPYLSLCPHVGYQAEHTVSGDCIAHLNRGQCYVTSLDGEVDIPVQACRWRTYSEMRDEVERFVASDGAPPEFWGWYSSFDFVALCQIFGTMMDLPAHFPRYIRDLQYILDELDISDDDLARTGPLPAAPDGHHNALADARYIRDLWHSVTREGQRTLLLPILPAPTE
jgi:hypothetical protein